MRPTRLRGGQPRAVWSSGMIRAQGARGPGFGSRNGPCCSIAKAPRALNPTMAPCRPNTLNSMIGCDVTVIYDANGLKFDALNIVDPATGFQILAVLDGPRCWRAPAPSWAQTEPLPAILLHFRCKVYTLAGMPRQHDSLAEWSKALGCSTAAVWMSIPVAWLAVSAAT